MDAAIYGCPTAWEPLLPPETCRLRSLEEAAVKKWLILALTVEGCRCLKGAVSSALSCRLLLVPGEFPECLTNIHAETVITYGLSSRDSLTLSSLAEPLLCIQRALPRLDGTAVDPQELPLPPLPGPAEELLPLLGLWLLQIPLTEQPFL